MSHQVQTMAYVKARPPWHGLGVATEHDLTPEQMYEKSGNNFEVIPSQNYYQGLDGEFYKANSLSLIRKQPGTQYDGFNLGTVPADWKAVQNKQAFEFFDDWVKAGKMDMESAGVLDKGRVCWALARIHKTFEVVPGDAIEGYFLFTNPHKYGWSINVGLTEIRVECMNTLQAALEGNSDKIIRLNHRKEFNAGEVKETLERAYTRLDEHKEACQYLAQTKAKNEDVVSFFKRIFPMITKKESSKNDLSKNAGQCIALMDTQPGAKFGEGSWWQPYNAVTHFCDHSYGQSPETRLFSAWYGENRTRKQSAFKLAVKMAKENA